MLTDQEMLEEKIAADMEGVEDFDDEPNSALKEWALKCHEIMDRIERDQIMLRIQFQNLLEDEHDCAGIKCTHPSHEQI